MFPRVGTSNGTGVSKSLALWHYTGYGTMGLGFRGYLWPKRPTFLRNYI